MLSQLRLSKFCGRTSNIKFKKIYINAVLCKIIKVFRKRRGQLQSSLILYSKTIETQNNQKLIIHTMQRRIMPHRTDNRVAFYVHFLSSFLFAFVSQSLVTRAGKNRIN